jgi:photosystem II stability/assembly factor-like uncharacterized protein
MKCIKPQSVIQKIITRNLIFLFSLFLLIGCKKKDIPEDPNTNSNTTTPPPPSPNTNISFNFETISLPSQVAGKNLYSISKQDNNLYVAGDGLLLKSSDDGTTWSVLYENNNMYFFDIKFTDSQTGYAVGWPKGADALNKISTLYKTIDGGINWFLLYSSTRPSSSSTRFNEGNMRNGAIDFLDESRLIWGCGTTQFYSVTGGRGNHNTITPVQTYAACIPNINKAFFGSSGVLESLKGGVSFGISGYQSSDYYDFDLVTTDDLYAIAGGAGNELYQIKVNQTNTSTYKSINGSTSADKFYGLDFLDLNFGLIVGTNGKIFYTKNAGDLWESLNSTTTNQLNDILFYNNQQAIVIGNNNTILKVSITNSPSTYNSSVKNIFNESSTSWYRVNSGNASDLYDIEFKNGNTYVAGDGVILKSTDLGASFSAIYTNLNLKFRDISFVDATTGWTIAYNNSSNQIEVYKTTDGGQNWALQTTLIGGSPGVISGMVVEAFNANYVFASFAYNITSNKKITNDGGTTWANVGGNYEAAPIADFIFFGTNFTTTGHQGYGPKLTGGGSYLAQNLDTGGGGDNAGCNSLTYTTWIKNYGMNSISSVQNHLAIARDMEYILTSQTTEGLIERSKIANPTTASDWGCYYTYTDVHFYGVKMITPTEIWLCGENGTIINTKNRNGGIISSTSAPEPQKEWNGHNTGTHENLYDIELLGSNIILAIGKNGTIIRSN